MQEAEPVLKGRKPGSQAAVKKKAKKKSLPRHPRGDGRLIRDYGGNSHGKYVPRMGSTVGICNDCGEKTCLPKTAWQRRTRPTCPRCGGLLTPSEQAQQQNPRLRSMPVEDVEVMRCTNCGAKLRVGNAGPLCSPCTRNPGWRNKKAKVSP